MIENQKEIAFDSDARTRLFSGVDVLAKAVRCTLGPSGRNVVITRSIGTPYPTKDGVSVARQVSGLEDPVANSGAQMVREAATKVAEQAGDGTTTATILAHGFAEETIRALESQNLNVTALKRHIDILTKRTISTLTDMTLPANTEDMLRHVATISANGDQSVASNIVEAVLAVGMDGVVTVDESSLSTDRLTLSKGISFDVGYINPHFAKTGENDDRKEWSASNVAIFVTDAEIDQLVQIGELLDRCETDNVPLLIIASEMNEGAIVGLIMANRQGRVNVCVVRAPSYAERRRDILSDIAVITGGDFVTESVGFKLDGSMGYRVGVAKSVRVTRRKTIIMDGGGNEEEIEAQRRVIRQAITESTVEFDQKVLEERLSMLAGKAAVIEVGGFSELEMKEKKDRYDDAVHAVRAAMAEGVLPGGGYALTHVAARVVEEYLDGTEEGALAREIFLNVTRRPRDQILENQGFDKISPPDNLPYNVGYDMSTHATYPLIENGIVDPLRVTRLALETGASVGVMIATTACVIVDKPVGFSARRGGIMN